jgi:outer membrane protein OmpA-like peptidoglycan-associated protein
MKTLFTLLLILLLADWSPSFAQSTAPAERDRIGLFGNYAIGMHTSSFRDLTVGSCCPEFTSATGSGLFLGLGYIKRLSSSLDLSVRAHYGSFNAAFRETESKVVILGNSTETATISHELDAKFSQLSVEPLLGYNIAPNLWLQGGLTAGFLLSRTYEQVERLVSPQDGVFGSSPGTGTKERNRFSGDIDPINAFGVGITVGARYDLAANASRTVVVSPEVLFTYNPMSSISTGTWNMHHLRFGLGVSFVPPDLTDELSDEDLYTFARSTPPPVKGAPGVPFVTRLDGVGLTAEGTTTPVSSIQVEEFASTRVRPLLPYVFFDQGSSTLPERYRRVREDRTDAFSVDNFYNIDAMVTYQHLLNIVGKRMQEDPAAKLTITGCADPSDGDVSGSLAAARAETVKSYLTSVWGIESNRLSVERRALPEQAANTNDADGRAENRRVELRASSPTILAPVTSRDTARVFTPAGLRLTPSMDPRVPIASWTVFTADGERILRAWHGGDPLPASVDWRLEEQSRLFSPNVRSVEYLMATRDSGGAVVPSGTTSIPVRYTSLADKQGRADKELDRYSMILFGFDKSDVTPAHQPVIDAVKSKMKPNSTVRVVGYTDRSGTAEYNQRLSEQRARSVARALGVPETQATGLGERFPPFDNSTPEGRFYSRTVEVFVETPTGR